MKDLISLFWIVAIFTTPIIVYKLYSENRYEQGWLDATDAVLKNGGAVPKPMYDFWKDKG